MINREDIERIIAEKEYWQKDRAESWDSFTRHMEMGELREYKQHCIDEDIIIDALKEYLHYKDLQEAGRLVELPCAVGDTVYGIFCGKVYPKKITRIEINPHTNPKLWMGTKFDFTSGTIDRIDMVLGKTVFLTREEAEAALEALKGGGQNG